MLQHPSETSGTSQRTILTASDGTNHVVYNLHTMSPNSNIISCDSIEETTVTPITPSEADLTVRSTLDDDLNEFVICEKTESPRTSSYNVVVVAANPPTHNVLRHTVADSCGAIVATVANPASVSQSFVKDSPESKAKFMCSKCGSKFSALRNMKRHYHHECGIEPRHGCEYCPMRFKRRNLLKYHVLRKHTAKSNWISVNNFLNCMSKLRRNWPNCYK